MSVSTQSSTIGLGNYIAGKWLPSGTHEYLKVINPATNETLAEVPVSTENDVAGAVEAASRAFPEWRRTPPEDRIQYLFKLKQLLERHIEDLSRLVTLENGKTLAEARVEVRRGIECVEVACGIPTLMQGCNLEDVAPGIDEMMIQRRGRRTEAPAMPGWREESRSGHARCRSE